MSETPDTANSAAAAAIKLGLDIERLSKLPDLEREIAVVRAAKEAGVDVSFLRRKVAAKLKKAKPAQRPTGNGADHDQAAEDAALLAEYGLTEDGIALAFAAKFRDRLRYCHSTGAWFEWNGSVWRKEETKLAFAWARETCRRLVKEKRAEGKVEAIVGKASTAAAVERFAQSDRAFAVTSECWDRDPFLLGTPGGTVDLRTGKLRAAVQTDFITKATAVAPADDESCPRWLQFLNEATREDKELIRFLQQWCGYCLTGDVREHALLFVHGFGGNGKGVFLVTVADLMGDYATTADMDAFTSTPNERHSTDLAGLKGARMVRVSETEEGKAWAENRIKALTGGDKISARFMRQDFFDYYPQFKLLIIGNHRPVLRNVDDAAKRRINMAPFLFKPNPVDPTLGEKLRAEWPGILRWMINGCLDWQQNGLIRPSVVLAATAKYFADQNTIGQWIEDCCTTLSAKASVGTLTDSGANLFGSWTAWTRARGEEPGSAKRFANTMEELGYPAIKDQYGLRGRGFLGIRLNPIPPLEDDEDYGRDD